jgi:hypothetical protein
MDLRFITKNSSDRMSFSTDTLALSDGGQRIFLMAAIIDHHFSPSSRKLYRNRSTNP